MTFLAYIKQMLADELNELGFKYCGTKNDYHGPKWYKLIDDMFYLQVWARNLGYGFIEIWFSIDSLLGDKLSNTPFQHNLARLMTQELLNEGKAVGPLGGFVLRFLNDNEKNIEWWLERGRRSFALARPILESVYDFESCLAAKQRAGYAELYFHGRELLGREYTPDDYAEFPPLDVFFILCYLERFDDAAEYIQRYMNGMARSNPNDIQILEEDARIYSPYMEMAKNREVEKIRTMMIENYNTNCDILEERHGIKIDRSRFALK